MSTKKRRPNIFLKLMTEYCRIVPGVRITKNSRLFHPANFEYNEDGITFIITNMSIAMSNLGIAVDPHLTVFDPVNLRSERNVAGVFGEMSQKFMALRVTIDGNTCNIILNGGMKEMGTSARIKESLVIYFASHPELVDVAKNNFSGSTEWKGNYATTLLNVRTSINTNHIQGVSAKDNLYIIEEIDSILRSKSVPNMRAVEKTIMCSYSVAMKLAEMFDLSQYYFDRGDLLQYVRKVAVLVDGNHEKADNCYPIDIVMVKKSTISYVRSLLDKISNESDEYKRNLLIDEMFYDVDDDATRDNPIVGISLKEDMARLGRCKSAIGKITNLTDEEKKLTYHEKVEQIARWRKKLLESKNINFKYIGDIYDVDVNTYKQKYMTLKMLDHLDTMMGTVSGNSYIDRLIKTCVGIKNFPYMMMKGNRSGLASDVEISSMTPKKQLESSFKILPLAWEAKGFSIYLKISVVHEGVGKTCNFIIGINSNQNSMELQSMK